MKNKILVCFLLVLTLFASCKTGKQIKLTDKGFMYAMIYDFDNTPVSGVTVYINGVKNVDSDIQGRFILDMVKKGEYRIKLVKKGYETLEERFYFDPLQVLYFKIINTSQLVALAETALDRAEFTIAENYINRALLLEPNRSDILFLKSIVYYSQAKYDEAEEILEKLLKSGNNEPSISRLLEIIRRKQQLLLKDLMEKIEDKDVTENTKDIVGNEYTEDTEENEEFPQDDSVQILEDTENIENIEE